MINTKTDLKSNWPEISLLLPGNNLENTKWCQQKSGNSDNMDNATTGGGTIFVNYKIIVIIDRIKCIVGGVRWTSSVTVTGSFSQCSASNDEGSTHGMYSMVNLSSNPYNLSYYFCIVSGDPYNLACNFCIVPCNPYNLSCYFCIVSSNPYNLSCYFWYCI